MVYRHLRTPDRRGQALPLRHQGRLLQSDRRLFHGCGCRPPSLSTPSTTPSGPETPPTRSPTHGPGVDFSRLRASPQRRRAAGIDGESWHLCRQRRHGIILRPAAKERAQHQEVEDARNFVWPSPPGSRRPTTVAGVSVDLGDSRQSNMRPSTASQKRPSTPDQPSQLKAGQSLISDCALLTRVVTSLSSRQSALPTELPLGGPGVLPPPSRCPACRRVVPAPVATSGDPEPGRTRPSQPKKLANPGLMLIETKRSGEVTGHIGWADVEIKGCGPIRVLAKSYGRQRDRVGHRISRSLAGHGGRWSAGPLYRTLSLRTAPCEI